MSAEYAGHPRRIQRKRTKGWRMPEGAVYVGRPTVFGNPFYVNAPIVTIDSVPINCPDRETAVARYRAYLNHYAWITHRIKRELRGKNLACWCPLDKPCHADVLLEIANAHPANVSQAGAVSGGDQ